MKWNKKLISKNKLYKKKTQKNAIMKSPSLERITDTRNTNREVLIFKYLKTIERPKQQNLYSPFQHPHARTT